MKTLGVDQELSEKEMVDEIWSQFSEFIGYVRSFYNEELFINHFLNDTCLPFSRVVCQYNNGCNPFTISMQLFRTFVSCAGDNGDNFDPMEASVSFLGSFLAFGEENPEKQPWLSGVAPLIPEIAKALVAHYGGESSDVLRGILTGVCLPLSQIINQDDDLNPFTVGMQLFQAFVPYASDIFDPMEASVSFLGSFLAFGEENPEKQPWLSGVAPLIPGAVRCVALSKDIDRAINLVSGLLTKNDELISPFFGKFEPLACLDSYMLAIKMLACNGDLCSIRSFFSVLRDRIMETSVAFEAFLVFAASIFEVLMEVESQSMLVESLCYAKKILQSSVIPQNMQFDPGEDEGYCLLCQIVNSSDSESVDDDIRRFVENTQFWGELREIPIYMYEPLGRLLSRFCTNDDVLDFFGQLFSRFEDVSFAARVRFAKPAGYKLLYLHEAFTFCI
jgi:hypothetical protein